MKKRGRIAFVKTLCKDLCAPFSYLYLERGDSDGKESTKIRLSLILGEALQQSASGHLHFVLSNREGFVSSSHSFLSPICSVEVTES